MVDGKTRLSDEYFNPVWKDIDVRLDKLENKQISWDTAVRELNAFGLERIDNVLAPLIASTNEILQNADDKVAELEVIISEATDSIDVQLQEHTDQVDNALQDALDTVSIALGGTVPTGAIIIWTGTACPDGWSRATELDGLFLKGADTGSNPNLTPAGANTHTHDITHNHALPAHEHTMSHTHNVPGHTHTFTTSDDAINQSNVYDNGSASVREGTTRYRKHAHAGTTESTSLTTDDSPVNTGSWSGNTDNHTGDSSVSSNEPEHVTVLFCKKNAP